MPFMLKIRWDIKPGREAEFRANQAQLWAVMCIVVKFKTKPDWTERWLDLVHDFSKATRAEAGNLWFEWSRSVQDPNEFVLVEAFRDDGAAPHVNSGHFKKAMQDMPQALA